MFGLKTGSRYSGSVVACPALQIIVYQRFDLTENVIQIRVNLIRKIANFCSDKTSCPIRECKTPKSVVKIFFPAASF